VGWSEELDNEESKCEIITILIFEWKILTVKIQIFPWFEKNCKTYL
jgi:hypothetical protein